jgi:hypothetical protein
MSRRFAWALLAAALWASHDARAQGSDRVAAESLFQDGKRLMAAGNYAEACPKFETSQRLDPGVGTQLNLADCYEKSGKTASAWAMFLEAASGARAAGNAARDQAARDRAAALAGRLARLTVSVTSAHALSGMVIKRDGVVLDRALWGTSVPVDPGTRLVEVTAPGRKPWSTKVQVRSEKSELVVDVPELEKASDSNGASSLPDVSVQPTGGASPILGLSLLGLGAAGVVVGSVLGLAAKSKWDEARTHCPVGNACYDDAFAPHDDATKDATISTIAFAVGGVGLAAGTIVLVTSRGRSANQATTVGVRASIDPRAPGVRLYGAF